MGLKAKTNWGEQNIALMTRDAERFLYVTSFYTRTKRKKQIKCGNKYGQFALTMTGNYRPQVSMSFCIYIDLYKMISRSYILVLHCFMLINYN